MRHSAHKLALLAGTVLAAMAFTTSTAAANPVEVLNEDTLEHCDPCLVHAVSESPTTTTAHVFGSEIVQSACNDEFEAEIYEDGEGHIDEASVSISGATCGKEACTVAPEDVWPLHIEETGPLQETLSLRFCLQNIGDPSSAAHCDLAVDAADEGGHAYELSATDEQCSNTAPPITVEVDGHWIISNPAPEGHDEIEIEHL